MGAALQIPAELDKGLPEPADDVEPVQDMLRLRQVLLDSRPVGGGSVGDDHLHPLTPFSALVSEEPGQGSFGPSGEHRQRVSLLPVIEHRHILVSLPDRGFVHQKHPAGQRPTACDLPLSFFVGSSRFRVE